MIDVVSKLLRHLILTLLLLLHKYWCKYILVDYCFHSKLSQYFFINSLRNYSKVFKVVQADIKEYLYKEK